MPIPVSCSECSARLNAPDAAAGKSLKCPKCGAKIVVPSPSAEEQNFDAPTPPKPKGPPAPPPTPKKASKPEVNLDDDEDFADEPKPKAKKPSLNDDNDFGDEELAPKKGKSKTPPKKKKNPLLLIGVIGGVLFLLCAGGIVGVYFAFFAAAKNVVNNIDKNNPFKPGDNSIPPTTLPVDPNPQVLNPLTSFRFEPSEKKAGTSPNVSRMLLSENGKTLAVVYSDAAFESRTDFWQIGSTPKRLFSLKGSPNGMTQELLSHTDGKNYQLSDGKPIDKPFIGVRDTGGDAYDINAVYTDTSVFRWSKPYAELKGRKPFNVFEDTKDKKIVTHKVTDDERIELGGVDTTRSLLAVGLRPENKILLYEFATKKIKREIVLAEPRPLNSTNTSGAPSWNGFEIDPSLKWYGVTRAFVGKDPDPYEIFDGNGNVVVKLNNQELIYIRHTFLPNRDRFVTGLVGLQKPFETYDVAVLNLKTKMIDTLLRGQKQLPEKLIRSQDGSTVATITKDLTIYVWDVSKLK